MRCKNKEYIPAAITSAHWIIPAVRSIATPTLDAEAFVIVAALAHYFAAVFVAIRAVIVPETIIAIGITVVGIVITLVARAIVALVIPVIARVTTAGASVVYGLVVDGAVALLLGAALGVSIPVWSCVNRGWQQRWGFR